MHVPRPRDDREVRAPGDRHRVLCPRTTAVVDATTGDEVDVAVAIDIGGSGHTLRTSAGKCPRDVEHATAAVRRDLERGGEIELGPNRATATTTAAADAVEVAIAIDVGQILSWTTD